MFYVAIVKYHHWYYVNEYGSLTNNKSKARYFKYAMHCYKYIKKYNKFYKVYRVNDYTGEVKTFL